MDAAKALLAVHLGSVTGERAPLLAVVLVQPWKRRYGGGGEGDRGFGDVSDPSVPCRLAV